MLTMLAALAGLLLLAACSSQEQSQQQAQPTPGSFQQIYDACIAKAKPQSLLAVLDGGATIRIRFAAVSVNDNAGSQCALEALNTPEWLLERIQSSDSADPLQTASDGAGRTYSWSVDEFGGVETTVTTAPGAAQ